MTVEAMSFGALKSTQMPTLFVRSMAIEAGGVGFVVAIVDLPGMGNQNTRTIREMVAQMSDLEEAQVLVDVVRPEE